jgi:hypothetical protein
MEKDKKIKNTYGIVFLVNRIINLKFFALNKWDKHYFQILKINFRPKIFLIQTWQMNFWIIFSSSFTWLRLWPEQPDVRLSDDDFFTSIPPRVAGYSVPQPLPRSWRHTVHTHPPEISRPGGKSFRSKFRDHRKKDKLSSSRPAESSLGLPPSSRLGGGPGEAGWGGEGNTMGSKAEGRFS